MFPAVTGAVVTATWQLHTQRHRYCTCKSKKNKALPVTGREMLRIPRCLQSRFTDGDEGVSLYTQAHSWFPFLLETGSIVRS
jgi:hypothetical protein